MKLRRRETDELVLFQPEGALDLLSLESVRSALLDSFDRAAEGKKPVCVDLSRVTEFDTPALQLFLSAKQSAKKRNLKLRLVNHTEPVLKNITLLGAVSLLADPVKIRSEDKSKYVLKYGLSRVENNAD